MSFFNKKFKYISISLFYLIFSKFVSLSSRLGIKTILARFSTTELFGLYGIIWSEFSLISTILLLGLGQQLTIELPRKDETNKSTFFMQSIGYGTIISIVCFVISIIFYILKLELTLKYSLFVSSAFLIFTIIQFAFIGLKDFLGYLILNSIQNLISVLLFAVFRNSLNLTNIILFLYISVLISIFISLTYIIVKYKLVVKELFQSKFQFFSFNERRIYLFIIDIVNTSILYLLLKIPQIVSSTTLSAYISTALSFITLVLVPTQMIATSIGPMYSEQFAEAEFKELNHTIRLCNSLVFIFQGFTILLSIYLGPLFIQLLYGYQYYFYSRFIFLGLIFTVIVESISYTYAFYLRSTNHENIFAFAKITSLISYVLFSILFVNILESTEKAIVMAYTIIVIILFAIYLIFGFYYNEFQTLEDIKKIGFWLMFMSTSLCIGIVMQLHVKTYLLYFAVLTCNLVAYIFFIVVFRIINVKKIVAQLKEKIRKRR